MLTVCGDWFDSRRLELFARKFAPRRCWLRKIGTSTACYLGRRDFTIKEQFVSILQQSGSLYETAVIARFTQPRVTHNPVQFHDASRTQQKPSEAVTKPIVIASGGKAIPSVSASYSFLGSHTTAFGEFSTRRIQVRCLIEEHFDQGEYSFFHVSSFRPHLDYGSC